MVTISSKFNRGDEGWTIGGDARTFGWRATGGNPDGHLYWEDAASGDGAYWRAPAKFTGDLSAFLGGGFGFQAYASNNDLPGDDVAIAGGNGVTLIGDVGLPGTGWTSFSIKLSAGNWRIGTSDGPFATKRQIAAVLADVDAVLIRAEHVYGDEFGGLDNVAFKSPKSAAFAADDLAPTSLWDGASMLLPPAETAIA